MKERESRVVEIKGGETVLTSVRITFILSQEQRKKGVGTTKNEGKRHALWIGMYHLE